MLSFLTLLEQYFGKKVICIASQQKPKLFLFFYIMCCGQLFLIAFLQLERIKNNIRYNLIKLLQCRCWLAVVFKRASGLIWRGCTA